MSRDDTEADIDPRAQLRRVSDPRTMRALSHPVRLALIEALTAHGQLTATHAGELIAESPTTCSFHLRQLAKYGFVEEAGAGPGRQRPWRLVHVGWTTEDSPEDVESQLAADALSEVTLDRYVDRHRQWQHVRAAYPKPWREVGGLSQTIWWVSPTEAADLEAELRDLFFRLRDRLVDPARRPAGTVPVELVAFTHVMQPPSEVTTDAAAGGNDHTEPGRRRR